MVSFVEANRLYNEGKYQEALVIYKKLANIFGEKTVLFDIQRCQEQLSLVLSARKIFDLKHLDDFYCKPIELPNDIEKYKNPPNVLPKNFHLPELKGLANDYTHLLGNLINSTTDVPVSIVITNYNRNKSLQRTLAGVYKQKYPQKNIEVIVVDDGSHQPTLDVIKEFEKLLNIKYFWHPDIGFTPAIARNAGVAVAKHDFIILLDVDMYPKSNLVQEYVKYANIIKDVVLIGPRKYVDIMHIDVDRFMKDSTFIERVPEIKTNNDVANKIQAQISVDWRLKSFYETDFLKKEKIPFRFFAAGNVAFSKSEFMRIGGFDERFRDWGHEDGELGFRFFNNGRYFIPVMEAWAYHHEPETGVNETDRSAGKQKSNYHYASVCPYYRHLIKDETINYEVPKVSIYIPAYNAQNTIIEAVESVLGQTYQDIEVCICDDGSTDDTLHLLEKYYSNNPKVRWVSQENGGIGKASNSALRLCRGLYIGQLDSDDILAKDVVEKCVPFFEKDMQVGLVYTSYENQQMDGTITPGYNYPVFTREKFISAMIVHHFRMFRRRDWARTAGFAENIKNAVDFDFYLKLAERTKVHHINVVGYRRRLHGGNTSVIDNTEQNKNAMKVVNASLFRQGVVDFVCGLESETSPKLLFSERITV